MIRHAATESEWKPAPASAPLVLLDQEGQSIQTTIVDIIKEIMRWKPRSGSASLASTSWFTWSAWVKWCNAWGETSRIAFTGPAQIGQGITDGNQLAAFTLHALFSLVKIFLSPTCHLLKTRKEKYKLDWLLPDAMIRVRSGRK